MDFQFTSLKTYEDVFGDKIHLKKIKILIESEQNNPAFAELKKKLIERKLVGLKGTLDLKVLESIEETKEPDEPEKGESVDKVSSSVPRIPDKVPAGKSSSALSSALKKIIAAHQNEVF